MYPIKHTSKILLAGIAVMSFAMSFSYAEKAFAEDAKSPVFKRELKHKPEPKPKAETIKTPSNEKIPATVQKMRDERSLEEKREAILLSWAENIGKGDIDSVIDVAKKATAENPKDAAAYHFLARAYALKKNDSEAISSYEKAIALGMLPEESEAARVQLAMLAWRGGNLSRAENELEKAIAMRGGSPSIYRMMAVINELQGKTDSRLIALKNVVRLNNEDADAYRELGEVYLGRKDYGNAQDSLRRAVRLNPSDIRAHQMLGWSLEESGNWSEAEKHLLIASRLDSADGKSRRLLGVYYVLHGDTENGVALLKEALTLEGDTVDANSTLGIYYYSAGNFAEAVPYLETAARLQEQAEGRAHEDIYGMLRHAYVVLGDEDSAAVYAGEDF